MSVSGDDDAMHNELCARARRLGAQWSEQAAGIEAARGLPLQAVDVLHDAQLLQIVMPARYGGLGLEWRSLVEVSRIAARSCASTAWTIGLIGTHVGSRLSRSNSAPKYVPMTRQQPHAFRFDLEHLPHILVREMRALGRSKPPYRLAGCKWSVNPWNHKTSTKSPLISRSSSRNAFRNASLPSFAKRMANPLAASRKASGPGR